MSVNVIYGCKFDRVVYRLSVSFFVLATIFMLFATPVTQAQTVDPLVKYIRLLQNDTTFTGTKSSFFISPYSKLRTQNLKLISPWQDRFSEQDHPQRLFAFYTPIIKVGSNSEVAFGQNDGAMWQGRGLNTALSFGGRFEYGPIEVSFRPQFGYSENQDFDLAPNPPFFTFPFELSEYAQGLARIDQPQRFGEESISWFHPGQSWIRLSQWGAAAGVSTANQWQGPALYNPLMMSNNAPGFFHAFLESDGPVTTPIGKLEARWFWGGLQESDYFNDDPTNNLRFITGLTAAFSPSLLEGLHVGFSRSFYENYPDDGLSAGNIFRVFQPFSEDRFSEQVEIDVINQETPQRFQGDVAVRMLSFFGRYEVPEYGFEVWAEWGKNDNSFDNRNILREPVHTRSYVLGLMKRFDLAGHRWLVADAEITQMENMEDIKSNNYPVWYEHHNIKQGFTHQGQVVGAGIGPGSNSQQFRVTLYDEWGLAGLSLNRVINNNDRLFRHYPHITSNQPLIGPRSHWTNQVPQRAPLYDLHETEYRIGGQGVFFLPYHLELQLDVTVSLMYNRYNIYENDIRNVNTLMTLRFQPPGFLR
ncbi:MAG: capsule assembly Wzi family protein [Candidatus Woykebacteria bacterium]